MKTFEFLIIVILLLLLGAAGFELHVQSGKLAQDAVGLSASQTACSKQLTQAVQAGVAIGKISVPRARTKPDVQPMYAASEIRQVFQ